MKTMLENNGYLQSDFLLVFFSSRDKKTGGQNEKGKILPEIKTGFCIVLDGGSDNKIITRGKGMVQLKLECSWDRPFDLKFYQTK